MYWISLSTGDIRRANLDGSDSEILVSNLPGPAGITLDVADGLMYWTDNTAGDIRQANLDGSGQTILFTGLDRPWGIALDLDAPVP
jgi:hypothetical protein